MESVYQALLKLFPAGRISGLSQKSWTAPDDLKSGPEERNLHSMWSCIIHLYHGIVLDWKAIHVLLVFCWEIQFLLLKGLLKSTVYISRVYVSLREHSHAFRLRSLSEGLISSNKIDMIVWTLSCLMRFWLFNNIIIPGGLSDVHAPPSFAGLS